MGLIPTQGDVFAAADTALLIFTTMCCPVAMAVTSAGDGNFQLRGKLMHPCHMRAPWTS